MKKLILNLVLVILIFVFLVGCNLVFPDRSESTDVLEDTTYTMVDFRRDWPEAIKVRISDLYKYDIVGSSFNEDSTIGEYIWITPVITGGYIWIVPMHPIQG